MNHILKTVLPNISNAMGPSEQNPQKRALIRRPVPSTDQAIQRLLIFFLSSRVSAGPQNLQKSSASKTKYEKFGPKI